MKKSRLLFALSLLLFFPACDWIHYGFMNSIPFHGKTENNPEVFVYLGIDGLSHHSTEEAMKRGAFADSSWHLSRFISMFPATSDASWTRILHTEPLGSYEFEFYDPFKDKIENKGILGLAKHVLPNFADSLTAEAKYLSAFDFRANGYTHSIQAYHDTYLSLAETEDNLFYTLDGRSETQTVFSAYILEIDVLGHMQNEEDIIEAVVALSHRIDDFKRKHPERKFHFTILSDHGMDFIHTEKDHLVEFGNELRKLGVEPVETLNNHRPADGLVAIPIEHTRVTYLAVHTLPSMVSEVAKRSSEIESVDLVFAKSNGPSTAEATSKLLWFGIWGQGEKLLTFGFDPATNRYFIPSETSEAHLERLALDPKLVRNLSASSFRILSDKELFDRMKLSPYPDLFYRVRTSLAGVATMYPSDLLVSFKRGYASMGFKLMGSDDIATAGFHGSAEKAGSLGTLLTDERTLPDAVRSETLLELFRR